MFARNVIPPMVTALLSLFVLAVSLMQSSRKPKSYDEIFTDTIAGVPRVGDIWAALARGTDLNPPLYYFAARSAECLLGRTRLAIRLPAALGYVLMGVCLYSFVARWYPAPYAWLAMLFPLVTQASWYAFEGRPYGLLLGFCALALLCWQEATEGVRRRLALGGLWLSLSAAVSTHYFGILIVVPLAAGELARSWAKKRIDVAIWATLLLGLMPLLIYVPLMAESRRYAATFWSKPNWRRTALFYSFLLADSAPALMALLVIAVVANRMSCHGFAEKLPSEGGRELPLHGLVAAATFALMPVLVMALAIIAKLGYTPRYALLTVIGVSLLVAVAARQIVGWRRAPAFCLSIALLAWYDFSNYGVIRTALGRGPVPTVSTLPAATFLGLVVEGNLPLAIPNAHQYLESVDCFPSEIGSKLVFLSAGDDTVTRGLRALSLLRPINVRSYAPFLAENKRFLVYQTHDDTVATWLTKRLLQDGAIVTLRAQDEKSRLWYVERRDR